MYKSIYYVGIRCKYNNSELKRFVGALQDRDATRLFVFRNREYFELLASLNIYPAK